MRKPEPVTLSRDAVRLEPMTPDHVAGLEAAARDGELWNLRVTSVPTHRAALSLTVAER